MRRAKGRFFLRPCHISFTENGVHRYTTSSAYALLLPVSARFQLMKQNGDREIIAAIGAETEADSRCQGYSTFFPSWQCEGW